MNNWLSSIAIIVLFSSIIIMILPEGKTSFLIKSILSIVVSLSIVSPIKSFLTGDFNANSFSQNDVMLQEEYLFYVSNIKIESYKDNINNLLNDIGVTSSTINFEYKIDDFYRLTIDKVDINLKNAVINSDLERIYLIESIKKQISEYLNISKDFVVIYE